MKTITLFQPWATLISIGAKRIETRSWPTKYRGPLAIHASKRWPGFGKLILIRQPFRSVLLPLGFHDPEAHALGAVVAICDLEACFKIDQGPLLISDQEKAFGDYTPGRYMWLLDKVRELKHPIPAKGALGLWDWTPPGELKFK